MCCFTRGCPPPLCTELLEAVADLPIVFFICFALYLVWPGSHSGAGEGACYHNEAWPSIVKVSALVGALVLPKSALENAGLMTARFHFHFL